MPAEDAGAALVYTAGETVLALHPPTRQLSGVCPEANIGPR